MNALTLQHAAMRALLVRAFVLWILVRATLAAVAVFGALAGGGAINFTDALTPLFAPAIIVITGGLSLIDVRRRGELALWGNLAMTQRFIAVVFGAVAAICELFLAIAIP